MADQIFDARFETLLSQTLRAEVAHLSVTVTTDQILERRSSRRHSGNRWQRGLGLEYPSSRQRLAMAFAAGAATVMIGVAGVFGWNFLREQKSVVGPSPSPTESPTAAPVRSARPPSPSTSTRRPAGDLGVFAPVSGRIVFATDSGIWGADPLDARPRVLVTSEIGTPLGWSRDGTELLIQKNNENLFVLRADGSETQVTEQLSGFSDILGSSRPSGATISPDGSRVVFAGLTQPYQDGHSCHDGGVFAVSVAGGPAELLWASHVPQNGIVRDPTYSPDGTQIAVADGYCDSTHSVWVMNADGSDAHQVVSLEDRVGAGHVYGLQWSPTGDRLVVALEGGLYSFAPDGSDFQSLGYGGNRPYWSPDGTQIVSTVGIITADGSFVRGSVGGDGPWHPGDIRDSATLPEVSTRAASP